MSASTAIPAEMRAAVRVASGDGTRLELTSVPTPVPQAGEVLIRVRTASLNRADLNRVAAPAAGAAPAVSGLDAAGEVAAVGAGVEGFQVGERVMAKLAGGYAEYAKVDARLLLPVPDGLSLEDAAASVLALTTEYHALLLAGSLAAGESVLIHAAASGVGLWAVQIAKLLGAGTVFATVRSGRADELLTELGADRIVNTSEELFADVVLAATEQKGVDVVVDHVGGPYLSENLRCLALGGRIVNVGRLGGAEGVLDMEQLAFKRATVVGTTSRTRSLADQIAIVDGVRRDLLPRLADGTLRSVVDRVLPFEDAVEAQAVMARNEHVGKIVLRVS